MKKKWEDFIDLIGDIMEFIALSGILAVIVMYVICAIVLVTLEIFG